MITTTLGPSVHIQEPFEEILHQTLRQENRGPVSFASYTLKMKIRGVGDIEGYYPLKIVFLCDQFVGNC